MTDFYDVNYRRVAIEMANGSLPVGKLNIRDYKRASDFFRHAPEQFFLMVVQVPDGSEKVIMLNRDYIISAEEITD